MALPSPPVGALRAPRGVCVSAVLQQWFQNLIKLCKIPSVRLRCSRLIKKREINTPLCSHTRMFASTSPPAAFLTPEGRSRAHGGLPGTSPAPAPARGQVPAPHIILPWVISILVFQRWGFQPLLLVASSHLAKWCPSTHSPSVKHSTGHSQNH